MFQNALDSSSSYQRQQLQREEQSWLVARDACGGDSRCLQNAYLSRIRELRSE